MSPGIIDTQTQIISRKLHAQLEGPLQGLRESSSCPSVVGMGKISFWMIPN